MASVFLYLIFLPNLPCKHLLSLYAKLKNTQTKPLITVFVIFFSLYKQIVS